MGSFSPFPKFTTCENMSMNNSHSLIPFHNCPSPRLPKKRQAVNIQESKNKTKQQGAERDIQNIVISIKKSKSSHCSNKCFCKSCGHQFSEFSKTEGRAKRIIR